MIISIKRRSLGSVLRVNVIGKPGPGPDGIGGQLLKNWAVQLANIFCFIFQLSLQLHKVPCHWKDFIIVPVPKNKTPKAINDFRPVALTCLAMKLFEKLVKNAFLAPYRIS